MSDFHFQQTAFHIMTKDIILTWRSYISLRFLSDALFLKFEEKNFLNVNFFDIRTVQAPMH